ncbi:Major sperm protein [Aphelenchoides fujianensis]|nr:Major sperm protein [Aphelenchoides fujianensis]
MLPLRQIEEEEEHGLAIAPHVAQFSSLKGGASRHLMANETDRKLAVKIKCSNNQLYRVSPVFCILEPGSAQRLQIVRDPGKPGPDRMIVLFKATDCKNAYDAFHAEDGEPVHRSLIVCVAKEPPKLASIDEFTIEDSAAPKTAVQPKPRRSQAHILKTPALTGGLRFPTAMQDMKKLQAKR